MVQPSSSTCWAYVAMQDFWNILRRWSYYRIDLSMYMSLFEISKIISLQLKWFLARKFRSIKSLPIAYHYSAARSKRPILLQPISQVINNICWSCTRTPHDTQPMSRRGVFFFFFVTSASSLVGVDGLPYQIMQIRSREGG